MNHCKHCNQLIDKYEEYDFVIIIIDLILHKSQVYLHLIFNRMDTYDAGIDPNLVKLAILLIFCDGYIKFSRVRALPCLENGAALPSDIAAATPVMHVSSPLEFVDAEMLLCMGLSMFQLLFYLLGIVVGAHLRFGAGAHVKANYLVMCVLASSFGKALYCSSQWPL
jgi:lipid intermediate transporter